MRPTVRARPEEACPEAIERSRPEMMVKHQEKSLLVQKEARAWLGKDGRAPDHELRRRTVNRNHVNVEDGSVLRVV